MTSANDAAPHAPLQPLLHADVLALRAPTQYWAAPTGEVGSKPVHGVYHGDLRHVREINLSYDGLPLEHTALNRIDSSNLEFVSLLRGIDDETADPKVRLRRKISVSDGRVRESLVVESRLETEIRTRISVRIVPDFAPMQEIKSGTVTPRSWEAEIDGSSVQCRTTAAEATFTISVDSGEIIRDGNSLVLEFPLTIPPAGRVNFAWEMALADPTLVVRGVGSTQRWELPDISAAAAQDFRIVRWLNTALDDLDSLRLALPTAPDEEFFAAGAPWFFTLFGRDSIWAARLALALNPPQARTTLQVLARLQSDSKDPSTAAAPGKIMHEMRSAPLSIPGERVVLPPIYYGTVDATPLWICLLADTYRAGGISREEVRELLPTLRAALTWVTQHGDSDGDGFLDYIDETGHGLANQGWKDSGDSIQWRTGELAQGPLALCEVQGYAYEAAVSGAKLLNELGEPGGQELLEWARELKDNFADHYWVTTPEGTYPAIALDAQKRPVDTLTSNIGHLLGTGILTGEQEAQIAELLTGESMLSGFGVRTLSSDAGGYWPLSYHGGSVWAHDTAIIVQGMAKAGLHD
ncbi:MAG TPA: glycogen debranching N-terminal domain-containing protein, partial [Actinomycetales bacterium]|nr:glycogen debranching N-terminal domain-containing protein [Actinomycetales bacterium]